MYLKLKIMELDLLSILNYAHHDGDVAYFMIELFWNDPEDKDYYLRFAVSSRMANTCRIFLQNPWKSGLPREIEDTSSKIEDPNL